VAEAEIVLFHGMKEDHVNSGNFVLWCFNQISWSDQTEWWKCLTKTIATTLLWPLR